MKLQSGQSVTVDILGSIQQLVVGTITVILQLGAALLLSAMAPIILAVLPQVLILRDPQGDFAWLRAAFFFATPLTVAVWMTVLCHWHSQRLWKREGYPASEWSEAHDGLAGANIKATAFMFLGLFGSLFFEFVFMFAFNFVPSEMFDGMARSMLWFALFPFAAYAPVIMLLVKRRNYSEAL